MASTNRGNINFYFDVEATDLQKGNVEKIFKDDKIHKTGARGSIPQLIQFFGGTSQEVSSYAQGDTEKALNVHTLLKVNNPDYYQDLDLQFTYAPDSAKPNITKTLNDQEIRTAIEQGGDLANILRNRQGEFSISQSSQNALLDLMATGKENPTAGMLPLSTMQSGSTMRKILASNVFEAKYNRPKMKETEQFISKFLNTMERKTQNLAEGQQVELRAWNISYDMEIITQNIDKFGTDSEKEKFQRLFGKLENNAAPIKIVDQADKLKNLQFDLMLADEQYATYHVDTQRVEDALKTGTSKEVIRTKIQKNILDNESSSFLKQNTALRNLATEVKRVSGGLERSGPRQQVVKKLENRFLGAITRSDEVLETNSVERKVVNVAAKMVYELANPIGERNSIETIRKALGELDKSDTTKRTMNRIFKVSDGSLGGIMGFAKDSDIYAAEDGSLHRTVLKFKNRMATGLDLQSGYSLGTGQGLINTFVQAKDTYIETLNDSGKAPEGELKKLFTAIDGLDGTTAGLHDASVDVRNMIGLTEKVLDRNYGSMPADVVDFMQNVLKQNAIASATSKLDTMIDGTQIEGGILTKLGVYLDGAMPGGDQTNIASVAQNTAETVGDVARSTFETVQKGMQTRGGVLTRAALITSGLVLLGNTSGDIKTSGSKHNTLEGMSPSGDPLLHSFGSGNDAYSNQALNNLKYNFNLGSETLRSSMLGNRGDRLYDMLLGRNTFNDYTRSAEKGNIVHKIIEQEYMSKGLAQSREHFVYSSELDVVGHIDLVLKSGVPLEIKSVEDFEALERLKSPKEKHVSQANFYAYALQQPYAIIGYAARNDPNRVKYFKVNTNIQKVMEDVSVIRKASADLRRQGHDVITYSAHKYMSDLHLQLTQNKYTENAVGTAAAVAPGMLASPEDYEGYSAIKSLGDYSRFIKKLVWRQERKANLTNSLQYKGKSKIRNQGKHADLHGNTALKYRQRQSGYHNQSRAMNYSGA